MSLPRRNLPAFLWRAALFVRCRFLALAPGIYEIMYGVRVNEFSVDKVRGLIRVDEAEGNSEENFNFSRARGIFVPRFQWQAKHKIGLVTGDDQE